MNELRATVKIEYPNEYNPEEMSVLIEVLCGKSLRRFVQEISQNLGGEYDALYEQEDDNG